MSGHIRLDRDILEWEWYGNKNTCRLFIHMILRANWKDGRYEGKDIPRGSFVSSVARLSEETNLSQREVRTAIEHLKMTGELTSKSHSKFTIFTINNYCKYQVTDKQTDRQSANNRQATDKQSTTIEEGKKGRREEDNKNTMCKASALTLFEELWNLYPVKKGKAQVSLAAKQRLLKVGREEMTRAIDRYKTELEKDSEWRKPQNGSTFFNNGYIDYLDSNYEPSDSTKTKKKKNNQFNDFNQRDYDYAELEKELLGN